MKLMLKKMPSGELIPADEETIDEIRKLRVGEVVHGTFTRPRNLQFHRKYFALLDYAFDHWEPVVLPDPRLAKHGVSAIKNKEQFRADLTILAGYYTAHVRIDGSTRIMPMSISFASMDEDQFGKLYQATINVILQRVLNNYTEEDLNRVVDEIIGFT